MSRPVFDEIRSRIAALDGQFEFEANNEASLTDSIKKCRERSSQIFELRLGYINLLQDAGEPIRAE